MTTMIKIITAVNWLNKNYAESGHSVSTRDMKHDYCLEMESLF